MLSRIYAPHSALLPTRLGIAVGRCDLLLFVYGKQQVVSEAQAPVNAFSFSFAVHFGCLRQPHVNAAAGEVHRAVLDGGMFRGEPNVGNASDQVRLYAQDLVAVRNNPSPAFQRDRIILQSDSVGPDLVRLVFRIGLENYPVALKGRAWI